MAHISTMEELGSPALDFSLPNTNPGVGGPSVSLNALNEHPALLVAFICNHCPYVIHIRDSFVSFALDYREKGLAVVAICANDVRTHPDDSPEKMAEEASKFGYPFPYLYDESQAVAKGYHAACTPDFFLYNRERTLVYRGQFDGSRPGNSEPVTGADLRRASLQRARLDKARLKGAVLVGVDLIDAPVSGSDRGARAKTMSYMVGGSDHAFKTCRPIFEISGPKITHTGPLGTGIRAKLAHQLIICVNMMAAHEGMRLGCEAGLPAEMVEKVVREGMAQSSMANQWSKLSLAPRANPVFYKDLQLCLKFAHELGL